MMLKRLDLGIGLMIALTAPLGAQSGGKFSLPPQGAVRQGVEARPPQTLFADPNNYYRNQAYPVQFTLVPAILMSNGQVFANFGFGYEPVRRSCGAVVARGPIQKVGAGGVRLGHANAMPYTQPVPNQMTASQQMTANPQRSAPQSCFTQDVTGRVFAHRR